MIRLHVNIDHVATVRQARGGVQPDPVAWALAAEAAGAHAITCHLRKDRRHIQDEDVRQLRARIATLLNLESSLDAEMIAIALESGAEAVCLVPENRQEITTEGGLDVVGELPRLRACLPAFAERGAVVSLFIDPDTAQVEAAAEVGAPFVELHTGTYSNAAGAQRERELERLFEAARRGHALGLRINAGHGLDLENVEAAAAIPHLEELNIGHALVARSLTVGVAESVSEFRIAIDKGANR